MSTLLPHFAKLGKFDIHKFGCESQEAESLKEIFIANKAVYHKNCFSKYNKQKLNRAQKSLETQVAELSGEIVSPKRARRSECRIPLGKLICLFCLKSDGFLCEAGTMHATNDKVDNQHVQELTAKIKRQALKLGETEILSKLSTGDLASNKIYYHKACLTKFSNRIRSVISKNENIENFSTAINQEFQKEFKFNKIINYIHEQQKIQSEVAF